MKYTLILLSLMFALIGSTRAEAQSVPMESSSESLEQLKARLIKKIESMDNAGLSWVFDDLVGTERRPLLQYRSSGEPVYGAKGYYAQIRQHLIGIVNGNEFTRTTDLAFEQWGRPTNEEIEKSQPLEVQAAMLRRSCNHFLGN